MEPKAQKLAIPPNEKALSEAVALLLTLPNLLSLKVTVEGIEVVRGIEDDEAVVPATIVDIATGQQPPEAEVAFLLRSITIDVIERDEDRHPLTLLILLAEKVRAKGLYCAAWYVAAGDTLDRFLAQERGTLPNELFGLPVHYVDEDQLPEGQLLLVGATTRHSIDAVHGVLADIGG